MKSDSSFHTTQWTRVLAAGSDSEDAKDALSELCEIYYEPVHQFIRHAVNRENSRDLAHEFFEGLLNGDGFSQLERGRGKFRSYLLGAVKFFLSNELRKRNAEKRGGGSEMFSLDGGGEEGKQKQREQPVQLAKDAATPPNDDAVFDRNWALAVLDKTFAELSREGRDQERFSVLKPWLIGEHTEVTRTDAAKQLGISEGAVKVAIHRLRVRMREILRNEIAQTLESSSEDDVTAELRYLIRALTQSYP